MLKGKNILFIAPIFHDYHLLIKLELEKQGAEVLFFPERKYSSAFSIINNFYNKGLYSYQDKHYQCIIREIKEKSFDYLFVIRGYMINESFLVRFKNLNPESKTIMYQWDSNRTNPFEKVMGLFDKVLSFDYEDCDKFKNLQYLPLFYTSDLLAIQKEESKEIYDFFFMGTYIPERYNGLLRFKELIKNTKYLLKAYIYIPKTSLLKERLKCKKLDMDVVSVEHMPRQVYLKLLSESKVIIDISNIGQTGMAMRIIEALALKKKVITSNRNITREPFYNEKQISIFNPDDPFIDSDFINKKLSDFVEVLSINKWLHIIFENDKDDN